MRVTHLFIAYCFSFTNVIDAKLIFKEKEVYNAVHRTVSAVIQASLVPFSVPSFFSSSLEKYNLSEKRTSSL